MTSKPRKTSGTMFAEVSLGGRVSFLQRITWLDNGDAVRRSGAIAVGLAAPGRDIALLRVFSGDAVVAAAAWTQHNSDVALRLQGDVVSSRIFDLPKVAFAGHFNGTLGELLAVRKDGSVHPLAVTMPSLDVIRAHGGLITEISAARPDVESES